MKRVTLLPLLMLSIFCLAACSASKKEILAKDQTTEVETSSGGQLIFSLASGEYVCEKGIVVHVVRAENDKNQLKIHWKNKEYNLRRDESFSGLPRFEDTQNGLVWIDLPWKSVLLDGHENKPIASECKVNT